MRAQLANVPPPLVMFGGAVLVVLGGPVGMVAGALLFIPSGLLSPAGPVRRVLLLTGGVCGALALLVLLLLAPFGGVESGGTVSEITH